MRFFTGFVARHWRAACFVSWASVTALSVIPLPEGPAAIPLADKIGHFLAYAIISFPIALARPRLWRMLLIGLVGWSGLIELVQPLAGREREAADLVANGLGVAVGTISGVLLRRPRHPPDRTV